MNSILYIAIISFMVVCFVTGIRSAPLLTDYRAHDPQGLCMRHDIFNVLIGNEILSPYIYASTSGKLYMMAYAKYFTVRETVSNDHVRVEMSIRHPHSRRFLVFSEIVESEGFDFPPLHVENKIIVLTD